MHACPVSRCPYPAAEGHLMCDRHWRLVPQRLKDEISKAQQIVSPRLVVIAQLAAIDAVNALAAAG